MTSRVDALPIKLIKYKTKHCCLPWCPNFKHTDEAAPGKIKYFPFPIERDRQVEWIEMLRMKKVLQNILPRQLLNSYFLCERHFEAQCVLKNADGTIIETRSGRSYLKPMSLPTMGIEGKFYTFYNQGEVLKENCVKREKDICCCVVKCRKQYCDSSEAEVALYKFPKNDDILLKWIQEIIRANQIRRGDSNYGMNKSKNDWLEKYVCSEHFSLEDLTPIEGSFYTVFSISPTAIPFVAEEDLISPDYEPLDGIGKNIYNSCSYFDIKKMFVNCMDLDSIQIIEFLNYFDNGKIHIGNIERNFQFELDTLNESSSNSESTLSLLGVNMEIKKDQSDSTRTTQEIEEITPVMGSTQNTASSTAIASTTTTIATISTSSSKSKGDDWVIPASQILQKCTMPSCGRSYDICSSEVLILFGFPSDLLLCREWLLKISAVSSMHFNLEEEHLRNCNEYIRICSIHFNPDDIETRLNEKLGCLEYRLKPGAIPARNLPNFAYDSPRTEASSSCSSFSHSKISIKSEAVTLPISSSSVIARISNRSISHHTSIASQDDNMDTSTSDMQVEIPPHLDLVPPPGDGKLTILTQNPGTISCRKREYKESSNTSNTFQNYSLNSSLNSSFAQRPKLMPDIITLSDSEEETLKICQVSPIKSLPSTTPCTVVSRPGPSSQNVKSARSAIGEIDIPLITQCYIIEAIQQTHQELCNQFDLSRSEVIQVWDNRKLIFSKDVLDED